VIPPLLTGYLLGKHVELRFKNGDVARGVVVRLKLAGKRTIIVVDERAEDYDESLGCWLPRRPRDEREYPHKDIESIMVIDRKETLVVNL
jgi:hypothetical protein